MLIELQETIPASVLTLSLVPGVGPKKAAKIHADRDSFADQVFSTIDVLGGHQHPRRVPVERQDNHQRKSGYCRGNGRLGRGKEIDITVQDRLRRDDAAHLNVLDVEAGFDVEAFLLGDVERQGGNRG